MSADLQSFLRGADSAHQAGQLPQAEQLYRQVLSLHPNLMPAKLGLGVVLGKMGKYMESVEELSAVVRGEPKSHVAWNWIAVALREVGRLDEAIASAKRAVGLRPGDSDTHYNLGMCLVAAGRYQEATRPFERAVRLRPDVGPYYYGLHNVYVAQGRIPESVAALREAMRLSPIADGLIKLGRAELSSGAFVRAHALAAQAVEMEPESAEAKIFLAETLRLSEHPAESAAIIGALLQKEPNNADAHLELALQHQAKGAFDEAEKEFKLTIQLNPMDGNAYYGFTASKKMADEDRPFLARMEELLTEDAFGKNGLSFLNYALGKAYDDLGEYERAMTYLDEANRLNAEVQFGYRTFDREATASQVEATKKLFTKEFFESNVTLGSQSHKPIFIVGMIRSGTTLMEQILSCHPDVGAAGEQGFWVQAESGLVDYKNSLVREDLLPQAAQTYLSLLEQIAPGKPHVTDKNPANLLVVGLMHLAFPGSRIIHMRRHPVDTFMSIYMTPIRNAPEFVGSREDIVCMYDLYLDLMEHWRSVIPADRFLDINYEELVTNREEVTRKALEFLGLPWSDACMRPQENKRIVKTPSLWQVRQPVYTSSVGRWKRYEPWLGAFAKYAT